LEGRKNDYLAKKSDLLQQIQKEGENQILTEKISEMEKDISTINEEIISKENLISTLNSLEERYLANKKALIETEKEIITEKIVEVNETSNLPDQNLILENDKKIVAAMSELLNQIKDSNNIENVVEFNKYLNYLSLKLSNISNLTKDDFALELMRVSSITNNINTLSPTLSYRRLYSNIEIFNEFQFIKRDLLNQIILQELNNCPQLKTYNLISIPSRLSPWVSKSAGLLLSLLSPFDLPIKGNESEIVKKLKAFHALHVNVEIGNHVEAYESLKYLKIDEGLLSRLRYKLQVMAKQQMMVDTLRNHFI
jgi:hypothetical protein